MSEPRVAVLSLTRDRLAYSQVCFKALRDNAGCDYDHFVFDQGSTDGTAEWLYDEYVPFFLGGTADWLGGEQWDTPNIGIHRAMNFLIQVAEHGSPRGPYDLLVKVDNDCRVLTPGTLRAVAEHVLEDPETPRVVSPLILGLRKRPGIYQTIESRGARIGLTRALGGIFFPLPPSLVKAGLRYDESAPVFGGDDERIGAMVTEKGGKLGYLLDYEAEHIDSTEGQVAKYPEYFARRVSEGGPPK